MKGIPQNQLKTQGDFERMHGMALDGSLRPRDVQNLRRYWQSLIDGRYRYDKDRELAAGEDPDGTEPEYRVITEEDEDGTEHRWQYKRVEDEHARINALGYSVSEVEGKIAELEDL